MGTQKPFKGYEVVPHRRHSYDLDQENNYEDVCYDSPYIQHSHQKYVANKSAKSKHFYWFGCFGRKGQQGSTWIYEPPKSARIYEPPKSASMKYDNEKTDLLYLQKPVDPRYQIPIFSLDKSVQTESQEQYTMDKTTQVPDVIFDMSKSICSQREGAVCLSMSDSNIENTLLESFTKNKDTVAKMFEKYGLTLQSIEKGSIRFKFTIRDAHVFSEGNMQNLLTEICREALKSIPERQQSEDISIEVELSSLNSTHYNINATSVQLGQSNTTYVTPEPTANHGATQPTMYINPIPSDPSEEAEPSKENIAKTDSPKEATGKSVSDEVNTAGGLKEERLSMSSTPSPDPCKQVPGDSAYGSGGIQVEDQSEETGRKTAWDTTSSQQYANILNPNISAHLKHDAQFLFKAHDQDGLKYILDELLGLRSVSFLEFELESDITTFTVKMGIFKRCLKAKDFFTSVFQFPIYPHLMTAITTKLVDVTIEVFSANTNLSHSVGTMQQPCDASICFKAPSQEGMNAIMDELEPLRPLSALKFDIESSNSSNSITMVIQRNTSSAEDFFTSVLQFPTYVHLMKVIVENMVDVKIQISSTGNNSLLYDTFSIQTISEDEQDSVTRKSSGFSRFFSSLRPSFRKRKKNRSMPDLPPPRVEHSTEAVQK